MPKIDFGAIQMQPQGQPFNPTPKTPLKNAAMLQTNPDSFKAMIVEKHPEGVASDGRKYSDIPSYELTQKIVEKFPEGKTNDGRSYSDFLKVDNAFKYGSPLQNIQRGDNSNVDVAKGAVKGIGEIIRDTSGVDTNPVVKQMLSNAPAFAENVDANKKAITPSNPAQEQGRQLSLLALNLLPAGEGAGAVGRAISKLPKLVAERAAIKAIESAPEAAGKIVQGTAKEAAIAQRALSGIDTKGVNTYKDLSTKIGGNIKNELKTVENEFASDVTPRKLSELTQTVKSDIGNVTAKVNYVKNALSQLQELYKKTLDLPEQVRISALIKKANKEGLTPGEINDIAKEYGTNFKAKGFSKTGEPLTSVNDRAFENTRSGIKETARSFLKSPAAQEADKRASDLIKVQGLVDKMAEKVQKLEQRVVKRTFLEKIGRGAGQVFDVATGGLPKAFISKLFLPSNVGLKTMNSLDLEAQLAKNLKVLQDLDKVPDNQIVSKLLDLQKYSEAGL